MKSVSIVVPVWNEEKNIPSLIKRIDKACNKAGISYELIFIDDFSTDETTTLLNEFKKTYPVTWYSKKGKPGKAFSLYEGFQKAKYKTLAMIDADLQYPPEVIPEMISLLSDTVAIVVADREYEQSSQIRKVISKTYKFVFGKILFGLNTDVQSGLKVFKKEIFDVVQTKPASGWTFDLEVLYKAVDAGYGIANYAIIFQDREHGKSKISIYKATWEIGLNAILLRLRPILPIAIASEKNEVMKGAGVRHKGNSYITHTTLSHTHSALITFVQKQKVFAFIVCSLVLIGLFLYPIFTLQAMIAVLSIIYFIDVLFNLFLVMRTLHTPQEITTSREELATLHDNDLPIYSILCPLYKEAHIIPQFLEAINKISWPKDKLDVMLLLEEDDTHSIAVVKEMGLPAYVRTIVVPHSFPKTKPKACNYGLSFAKGEYLVIYDAEDDPDPLQLKKAFLGFKKVGPKIFCLQAKLNYYNHSQNLLTRFFTAEYSLWFDVTLTGLQSINTSIPLGGTSNHFKTENLKKLEGWDPFNVTEDADLGMRLFKKGYTTAIIDSITLEEANSKWGNWLRQRSRWIKGYMQTYLVHTRNQKEMVKQTGIHTLFFHLIIGGKIAFILINPILWIATIAYFSLYAIVGPTIEHLYPPFVFYLAAFSLIFGNFLFLYYYMIGCAKKGQWDLIKYVLLIPIYWLMISVAGGIAFYQLIFKPHYWEKTVHGLHLKKKIVEKVITETVLETEEQKTGFPFPRNLRIRVATLIARRSAYLAGILLVSSTMVANVINFLFNAFLGRVLSFKDLALISLIGSFLSFSSIAFGAFSTTTNYKSGFLTGKFGDSSAYVFWRFMRKYAFKLSIIATCLWIILIPLLLRYFKINDAILFLTFSLVLLVGLVNATDKGFLSSKLAFGSLALLNFFDPIIRCIVVIILLLIGLQSFAYASIPLGVFGTFFITWSLARRKKTAIQLPDNIIEIERLPKKFLIASLVTGFTSTVFVSLDIIFANHYLTTTQAGQYALLSLVGKMIFFLGALTAPFVVPILSRNEGANKNSEKTLNIMLITTFVLSFVAFIAIGILGNITLPILYGKKVMVILPYVLFFSFGMMLYSVSSVLSVYYLVKKNYTFTVVSVAIMVTQIVVTSFLHNSVAALAISMTITWSLHFVVMFVLHIFIRQIVVIENNVVDFLWLFSHTKDEVKRNKHNILIFNWRDTKHKWSGGAETYVHEIAKRWVKNGHHVTIFCGNDGQHMRNELVSGVQIVRRGGFYTVYMWAFLYYILRFRNKYDVIIDSENGIPFFTPIFVQKPVVLLIHHVHQEVFRTQLPFPLAQIASFIESELMPRVYKDCNVITVSESSKKEISKLHFLSNKDIKIVHPGINIESYVPVSKTIYPSIAYLGRLKPYKNIDIAIKAFKQIIIDYPTAHFTIAGMGESINDLKKLVNFLEIEKNVTFSGTVTEEQKVRILGESWFVIQPSMIEGWGITVIEANASGTPVIASNVNGLKDSIIHGKTGLLVKVKSVNEFYTAMEMLIRDKKIRLRLSKEAHKWARQFSWDESAKHFFDAMTYYELNTHNVTVLEPMQNTDTVKIYNYEK